MTDDIVKRLREHITAQEWPTLQDKAADEIERLRAEVAALSKWHTRISLGSSREIVAGATAEIERLRAEAFEEAAAKADEIARGFRVYRDHWPHAEGAETVAAHIRADVDKRRSR